MTKKREDIGNGPCNSFPIIFEKVHPQSLTWNLKMMVLDSGQKESNLLFQGLICSGEPASRSFSAGVKKRSTPGGNAGRGWVLSWEPKGNPPVPPPPRK